MERSGGQLGRWRKDELRIFEVVDVRQYLELL